MAEPWPMVIRVQMSIRLTMIPNRSSGCPNTYSTVTDTHVIVTAKILD